LLSARKLHAQIGAMIILYCPEFLGVNEKHLAEMPEDVEVYSTMAVSTIIFAAAAHHTVTYGLRSGIRR
jgi:hypothetical protein